MNVSEYILARLREEGVRHAFGVTGGVITPLIDASDKNKNLEFIFTTQEQGAAMAAEAYSRATNNIGVAFATSGPGATNLITGIGCAYFDSIPTLYLTGQVNTNESTWEDGPRQVGFQETDIVKMVKPITKFAHKVTNPKEIGYYLDYAICIAKSGRPGPVLLDLPLNLQRSDMPLESMVRYEAPRKEVDYTTLREKIDDSIELINNSSRPVLILGAGVKLAKESERVRNLVNYLNVPVVPSWGAIDVIPHDHPLFVEGFGVSHNRAGNFAVQNSDLVLSIGSRLDTRQTGGKRETFAREAKKIVVDIDSAELYKGRG